MTIPEQPNDYYGTLIDNIYMPVSMYYLDSDLIIRNNHLLDPIQQSGQVLTMLYTPFLEQSDLQLVKIPYDKNYYGDPGGSAPDLSVYRIQGKANPNTQITKKLHTLKKYEKVQTIKNRSPINESKLLQYPYMYTAITDYINTPLIIRPEFFTSLTDNYEVWVRQSLSLNGGYTIYIPSYKGETQGQYNGLISAGSLDMPTSSSAYSQWLTTSKSQWLAQNQIAERNEQFSVYRTNLNTAGGILNQGIGTVGNILTGNVGGLIGDFGSSINLGLQHSLQSQQNKINKQNRIDNTMSFIEDKKRSPRNVTLTGNDLLNSIDISRKKVDAITYEITDYYKNRLCEYFTLYGYKQNKLMKIDTQSRKYFNYVKTLDVNIEGFDVDKSELEQIKEIFNNGITFWHYDNVNSDLKGMYDYSLDNVEVKL